MATRTVQVNVMLTPQGAKTLDKLRKQMSRSEYIRRAMKHAVEHGYKVEADFEDPEF